MSRWSPILLAGLAGMSHAASFDCAKAASAAEKAICAAPALGRADEAMATAYGRALTALSPEGRTLLRDEQRTFIAYTERECRPGGLVFLGSGDRMPQTFGHCLQLAFEARGRALGTAVRRFGGRTFLSLEHDRAKHVVCDDCTNFPAIRTEEVTLVQIDAPRVPGERAWNAAVRRRVAGWQADPPYLYADGSDAGDVSISAEISSASPELVSATVGVSSYGAGAPHPNYSSETLNWSFRLGRPLTAADLFANPRAPALRDVVTTHYGAGGYATHDGCGAPDVGRSKFIVDRTGVTFSFDPYELGGYPCGGASKVSWAELRPFLKRPLPFDPAQLDAPRPVVGAAAAR